MEFTGKERDSETGLDYFGARYFSSAQGRFTSPDWSTTPQPVPYANLNDPQTLNLYSYVRNNPLSNVDADGHCGIWGDPNCTWGQFFQSIPQRVIGGLKAEANIILDDTRLGQVITGRFTPSNAEQADAMANRSVVEGPFMTGLAMAVPGPKGEPVEAYEVGEFSDLKARSATGDNLDIHHVGQQNPMKQTVSGYDPKTGPAIALPESEHEAISTQRGPATQSPRSQLAKDAKDLRNKTNTPNSQIKKVIDLNKDKYPEMRK